MQYTVAQAEQMNNQELAYAIVLWDTLRGDWTLDDLRTHELPEITDQDTIAHNAAIVHNEAAARWSQDVDDNLADYATAAHASPEDMMSIAGNETDLFIEIAKGLHYHDTFEKQQGAWMAAINQAISTLNAEATRVRIRQANPDRANAIEFAANMIRDTRFPTKRCACGATVTDL